MQRKNGFTLVELLVVIAIIGILIGMLLPAVQQVREAARRGHCMNNMRQIGIAIMNYESSNETYPPGWSTANPNDAHSAPGWGWSAHILPFVEAGNAYRGIDFDLPIENAINRPMVEAKLPVFVCTSDPAGALVNLDEHIEHDHDHDEDHFQARDDDHDHEEFWVGRSNYSGVFGSDEIEANPFRGNGAFFANSKLPLALFRDGLSNTMIVGERRNDFGSISWVGVVPDVDEPFARIVGSADHAPNHIDGHFEDFRSFHPGGINVILGDGSAHFISSNINEEVFQSLATRDGDEVVSLKN